jgi:hypothetical protein
VKRTQRGDIQGVDIQGFDIQGFDIQGCDIRIDVAQTRRTNPAAAAQSERACRIAGVNRRE